MTTIGLALAILLALSPQASKPADPATLLERAKIAEDAGELAKAETLLREAAGSKNALAANEAKLRLDALRKKLGGADPRSQDSLSPIERRIADLIELFERSAIQYSGLVQSLKLIGEPAVPPLTARILRGSLRSQTRDVLVQSVATIGGESALALLEQLASDPDPYLRRLAMQAFRSNREINTGDRWIPVVSKYLDDSDAGIRVEAIAALVDSPEALRPRASSLARDPSPSVRAGMTNVPSVLSPEDVERLSRDPSPEVRSTVADSIGNRRWPNPSETVLRLLQDPAPNVRRKAFAALRSMKPETRDRDAFEKLLPVLAASPDIDKGDLCQVAREVLSERATPTFLKLAREEDLATARKALGALRAIPKTDLRREDLRAAFETAAALLRRYSAQRLIRSDGGGNPTPFDEFVGLTLDEFLRDKSTREDLPFIADFLVENPGLASRALRGGSSYRWLEKATPADVALLCERWPKLRDDDSRLLWVEKLGRLVPGLPEGSRGAVARVFADALAPSSPPWLAASAILPAIFLGDPSLGEAIVRTVERDLNFGPWEQLVGALGAAQPGLAPFATRALLAIASRKFEGSNEMSAARSALNALRNSTSPEAAAALAEIVLVPFPGSPEIRESVSGFVAGNEPYRAAALSTLLSCRSDETAEQLRNLYLKTKERWIKQWIPEILGTRSDAKWTAPLLLELALAGDEAVGRAAAIRSLANIGAVTPPVAERIAAFAKDPDAGVREDVAVYAQRWNQPAAVPVARALLKDSSARVRAAAVNALGSLLSAEAAPDLVELLADESSEVRESAKKALERIRTYHEEKRRWDDWFHGRGSDPGEGLRKLLDLLDDPAPDVRLAAIESLGTMKAKEALPILVERLKKASGPERDAVARAIGRINEK